VTPGCIPATRRLSGLSPPRYCPVIRIFVRSAEQVFNSIDPSPFYERDLDEAAERFILNWARDVPRRFQLELDVTIAAGDPAGDGRRPHHRGRPPAISAALRDRLARIAGVAADRPRLGGYRTRIPDRQRSCRRSGGAMAGGDLRRPRHPAGLCAAGMGLHVEADRNISIWLVAVSGSAQVI
jgi:hypothetical protein